MSALRIYYHNDTANLLFSTHNNISIRRELTAVGVRFEQWLTQVDLSPGAAADKVIAAFKTEINQLVAEGGYKSVDVISLNQDDPQKESIRQKFLSEHTHSDDEVRFFVAGEGLFSLHIDDKVYEIHCRKGDLISVPANTPHWFDMGPNPSLITIRLFNSHDGWEPNYTGNPISEKFNRLDN